MEGIGRDMVYKNKGKQENKGKGGEMMVREGRSVTSIYSHRPPKTFFQRSLPSHDKSPSTNPYSSEKGVETLRTRRYLKFGVSKRVSNRSSKNLCIKGKTREPD
jgi:hypothetical protein